MMGSHLLFRGKNRYYESDTYAAYRVKVEGFGKDNRGRTETFIVPANSDAEAETRGRERWRSRFRGDPAHGYHIETKRVADKYRERE